MKRNNTILLIAALVGAIVGAGTLSAQSPPIPAIAFDTYSQGSNPQVGNTIGWEFTTDKAIYVTALGYYDYAADGLGASHDVGIFDVNTTLLLTSATVAAGTVEPVMGNTAFGSFRYHTLPIPQFLLPGTYRIGGVGADNDPAQNSPVNLTVGEHITLANSYQTTSGTGILTYPNIFVSGPTQPFSGPNFLFIPEPSVAVLLGVSSMLLLWRRRK